MTVDVQTARRNALLGELTDEDLAALLPHLDAVPLGSGTVLYQAGTPIEKVYFPIIGVISLVHQLSEGVVVEVATVGREGMAGLGIFLGAPHAGEQAQVQVAGRALAMTAEAFRREVSVLDGPLQILLRRYTQAMFIQLSRNAACNRAHNVRQRAARWLLMAAERMDDSAFELTQGFLAQMLAVRRASVSAVARALAEDGCITYTRGTVTILDIEALHRNACECHDLINQATKEALGCT